MQVGAAEWPALAQQRGFQLTTRSVAVPTPPASSQKRMARDRNSQEVTRLVWKVHSHSRKVCRVGGSQE